MSSCETNENKVGEESEPLNDKSLMPLGKHTGRPMIEVPDAYLKWFWFENEPTYKRNFGSDLSDDQFNIMKYIVEFTDFSDED